MSRALLAEIPPSAYLTVTLKNGTKFTGFEDGQGGPAEAGLLRMSTGYKDDGGGSYEVFFADCSEIACFQMTCEA